MSSIDVQHDTRGDYDLYVHHSNSFNESSVFKHKKHHHKPTAKIVQTLRHTYLFPIFAIELLDSNGQHFVLLKTGKNKNKKDKQALAAVKVTKH